MSAVVCGKRSHFDDLHGSPPIAKRLRCSGSSPIRYSSHASGSSRSSSPGLSDPSISLAATVVEFQDNLLQLRNFFPEMEEQLVEKVLEACGNNLESAIRSLSDLRLSATSQSEPTLNAAETPQTGDSGHPSQLAVLENTGDSLPTVAVEGTEWVEHLVREMMQASDIDDARSRATRALEAFEKTLSCRAGAVLDNLQKENASLKEQLQAILRDNQILKRAVAIQHERQSDYATKTQELQQLKQLLTQYQEQLHILEINNYALTLHLRKAQEGTSIPGRFHPDVF